MVDSFPKLRSRVGLRSDTGRMRLQALVQVASICNARASGIRGLAHIPRPDELGHLQRVLITESLGGHGSKPHRVITHPVWHDTPYLVDGTAPLLIRHVRLETLGDLRLIRRENRETPPVCRQAHCGPDKVPINAI